MKRKIILFLISFCTVFSANAQHDTKNSLDYLHITWELVQNKYEGKNNQFLAQLTIENTSKTATFNANNWEMFFSYPREVIRVLNGDVAFKVLQGDYRSMAPTKDFKPILPEKKTVIQFVAKGFTQNATDAISGLYIVLDGKPISIKNFIAKPILTSGVENLSAEELFKKYECTVDLQNATDGVFPTPLSSVFGAGEFEISNSLKINTDKEFYNEAILLADDFKVIFGKANTVITNATAKNEIRLAYIEGLETEAYELTISNDGVLIKASHRAGAFYGIKSLTNLFPALAWKGNSKPFMLRALTIKDKPRFAYRSFMMDVARNFQSKAQVLKVIDLMSIYKLNTLHFHLNDDEGWRLEIPSLPELTQVGAKRAHDFNDENLQPSYGSGPNTANKAGTGYYTEADFIEILKYAAKRHIQVIPEIETPGHARAAIKAMNYRYQKYKALGNQKAAEEFMLVELDDPSVHKSVQGFTDNIMNVALPSTYHFIETVVDDMMKMYSKANLKLNTVHLGGDEVPNGSWQKSKAVKQLIDANTIETVDDLWYYYFGKMSEMFKNKGLQLAGWEEIALRKTMLDGKPKHVVNADFVNDNFNVYVWNTAWGRGNEDLAYKLANAGYKTVLASVSNFYFDLAYSKDNDERGLYWGGYVDTDKPFYFVPFDNNKMAKEDHLGQPVKRETLEHKERLTDFGKRNILGLQCLLWSEKVTTATELEYMLFPKLLGFAERAWATSPAWAEEKNPQKAEEAYAEAWSFFANRLGKKELPKLDYYLGGVAYRIPPVGLSITDGKITAKSQFPGLQIRYTTDGSLPTMKSKLYAFPINYVKGMQFSAFSDKGRSSKVAAIKDK